MYIFLVQLTSRINWVLDICQETLSALPMLSNRWAAHSEPKNIYKTFEGCTSFYQICSFLTLFNQNTSLNSEIFKGDFGTFEAVWFFLKRKAEVNKAPGLTVDWWPRVRAAFSQRKERKVAPHQFRDISFSEIYILHNFLASEMQPSWYTYICLYLALEDTN